MKQVKQELTDELGFAWFQGVVEDRHDPLMLGRCRIRCLGFHTQDKNMLPTKDLPWAHPMSPITTASMNGIGQTPLGMVEGTWVVGFFRDGFEKQQLVIIGTLPGIPQEVSDPKFGFNDPYGKYPLEDYINEPDTNRLARGITQGTIVQDKMENLDIMDEATFTGVASTVQEPYFDSASLYPFSHVTETESGHIIQMDDTPGQERINIHHKSGSFFEILPDGSMVRKSAGENGLDWVTVTDQYVHVKGVQNVTVEGNANVYIKGDSYTRTDLNHRIDVVGDYELNVGGKATLNAGNGVSRIDMNSSSLNIDNSTGINLNGGGAGSSVFGGSDGGSDETIVIAPPEGWLYPDGEEGNLWTQHLEPLQEVDPETGFPPNPSDGMVHTHSDGNTYVWSGVEFGGWVGPIGSE
jgi:hypothetical protein